MAQTFDDNLHIIEGTPIDPELLEALGFNVDLSVISALDDEPNDVGGLTAAELKAKFDEAGLAIQRYINEKLVPTILANDLTEKGRTQAEEQRAVSETDRAAAETARTVSEASRTDQEAERVLAEAARAAAEDARVAEEDARRMAEEHREAAEKRREEAASHGPYISDGGTWMVWDMALGGYTDTGIKAEGRQGENGKDGVLTQLGSGVFAMGVSEDGHLLVAVNEQDAAPPLEINAEGHLIYKINN